MFNIADQINCAPCKQHAQKNSSISIRPPNLHENPKALVQADQ
ncbi:hypothetical protein RMB13_00280 [Acinetobacter sp. V102_4]|nr:hypothetical protein [Acinetobacter sp. V102_4]MDS7927937.1 hypothetical protein [Acinetobacter sp. V102_4]